MSVTKVLYQMALHEIFKCPSASESNLKAWLSRKNYYVEDPLTIGKSKSATSFKLRINDKQELFASLANDCNRFSQASIESMIAVQSIANLPKSTAWTMVKLYYAAFFAAHAILRMYGRSCTQIDKSHVDSVYEIATLVGQCGPTKSISTGFYFSQVSGDQKTIDFNLVRESHGDTWASFHKLLNDLMGEIPNITATSRNKNLTFDFLSALKSAISQDGCAKGNWLSSMRNKINYRHTHGVWFPYFSANFEHGLIHRNNEWRTKLTEFDLSFGTPNRKEIETMYQLSNAIVSMMYNLLSYGQEREEGTSIIFKNGIFKLINSHIAA